MDISLEETVRGKNSIRSWLLSPFHYIAGGKALVAGVLGILLAGAVGSFSRTHFDGVLDVHSGMAAPLWIFLSEGVLNWIALALFLYLAGIMISRSRVRVADVFGTQALARYPTVIIAIVFLLPGHQRFVQHLCARFIKTLPEVETLPADPLIFAVVIIVTIVMIIWMVALMYRGFSVSCNLRGGKTIGFFVAALILGEALSKVLIFVLIKNTIGLPSFPQVVP